MNKRGQFVFAFVFVFFLIVITLFALIDPFKESLDNNRGGSTLNCPNTPDFNSTAYAEQNASERLTYRTTCFATGLSMVWFMGMVLFAGVVWVYSNWRKYSK